MMRSKKKAWGAFACLAVGSLLISCPNPANGAAEINVESVSLDQSELSLAIGETAQLTATVYPSDAADKSVAWSSDNTDVAAVSESGLVTAQALGIATITVTTVDGGKTASYVVHVDGLYIAFSAPGDETIGLSAAKSTIYKNGYPSYLTASVSGSYDSYAWYLDGVEEMGETEATYRVGAWELDIGQHTLTAIVEKGGVPYSKSVAFRVEDNN